ncbi:MAG: hypothetical protein RR410_05695 [Alistipes sp.]
MKTLAMAALSLALCGACAQQRTQSGGKSSKMSEKTMLCGAYTAQREPTTEEIQLFAAVTASLSDVNYTPTSVATQVVAGTNYRFICKAEAVASQAPTHSVEIIVYRPLPQQGEPRITQITRL